MVHFVHDRSRMEQWALLAKWSSKQVEWLRVPIGRCAIVPSSQDLVLKWAVVKLDFDSPASEESTCMSAAPAKGSSIQVHRSPRSTVHLSQQFDWQSTDLLGEFGAVKRRDLMAYGDARFCQSRGAARHCYHARSPFGLQRGTR
jgi:hypothetical protein